MEKTLEDVVHEVGVYTIDAYEFVQHGLAFTVHRLHGACDDPEADRHVSGQQLCEGLRDYALSQWGRLAATVLGRWRIRATIDFGRIVFAMVENGLLRATEEDTLDDFRNVFDFHTAFEAGYQIVSKA